jgi:hypothetical protein
VHSATRPVEFFPPTYGAPGRGLGFRFLACFSCSTPWFKSSSKVTSFPRTSRWRKRQHPPCHESPTALPPVLLLCTLCSTQQHTHVQTSRASRAAPGALPVARELLRNPPSSTTSSGAMRQWREDVNRLLGMTHSGSARPRPRSFRRQREASASVHSPSVRGARTNDLRAELNRRRAGEDARISLERDDDLRAEINRRRAGKDARISLERAREHRQNFEGRNLDQDFGPVSPQTPRDARMQTGIPLVSVGCAALADHLRVATWPPKFGHTCRRSTTGHQTRRNSCRSTSPPLRQLVETLL